MHADDKKGRCERYFNISSFIPQRLSQLLSLFVAIALTPSMLLADNEDHLNGRDKAHDPTGAWLVRNDEPGSLFILDVFHKDGTCTGDIQGASAFVPGGQPPSNVINSPESGVWQKTGWNTFAATFLSIEYQGDPNATFYQFDKVQLTGFLNESGDRMEITQAAISFYDSSGNQIGDTIQVPTKGHGVRIPLEILPNTGHTLPIPTP
jgi:hypothetical protein